MLTGIDEGGAPSGTLFLIVFGLIFLTAIGTFILHLFKSLMVWSSNNNALQDRHGVVVAKRIQLSDESLDNANSKTAPSYFALFEFGDQSRLELRMNRQQFGYLAEGDEGNLTFQGTRFKAFERSRAIS